MRKTVTDAQFDIALRILTTAMAILRDDEPFDPTHTIFGRNFFTTPALGSEGNEYYFENAAFPDTQIRLLTESDPIGQVYKNRPAKVVPTTFRIWFSPLIREIARSTLEELFPLDIGYWIDGKGNRRPGNDMGTAPPQVLLHHYRYRASTQPTSQFPVDVDVTFADPDPQNAEGAAREIPVLISILLSRDYSPLNIQCRK